MERMNKEQETGKSKRGGNIIKNIFIEDDA
ncbi:hypothetical protein CCACVL1_20248 [Corchorus capsularis]|uniref:Uncharacterized protein n=1 Tax=Corchorus capsularis TaxID=210143 RepID=A0A1R3HC80_COCAP|nr:hypothetical protein CCACVL1_20248 [Corchorus capsularis]